MLILSVWFMTMRRSIKVLEQFLGCRANMFLVPLRYSVNIKDSLDGGNSVKLSKYYIYSRVLLTTPACLVPWNGKLVPHLEQT